MEIILRERIDSLGEIGDLVKVKDGYARNYLIPKGLAYRASESAKKIIVAEKEKKLRLREEEIKKLSGVIEAYEGLSIDIIVKTDENNHMYGSVTSRTVYEKLVELGYNIDRKAVVLDEAIKTLGEHEVVIKFMQEVQTKIKVNVKAEGVEEEVAETTKVEESTEESKSEE